MYIYEYDVAAVIVSLAVLINFIRKKTISSRLTKVFSFLVIAILVSSLLDILSIVFIENPTIVPLWFNYFVSMAYYLVFNLIPLIYFYLMLFGTNSYKKIPLSQRIIIHTPIILSYFLILITPLLKTIFYFDENLNYNHGPFFFFLYFVSFIYVIQIMFMSFKYKDKIPLGQRISFYIFFTLSVVSIILQALIDGLLIIGFINSVCSLLVYLTLDNPNNYIDKEMNIYNRKALINEAHNLLRKNKSYFLLGIQLTGLRNLNNTIGVEKKNQLLIKISDKMSYACGNKKILFRISGSRLVILIPDKSNLFDKILEKVKLVFEDSFNIDCFKIPITYRATYLHCPEDVISVEDSLEILETTLQQLKEANPGVLTHADKSVLIKTRRENKILTILKEALRANNFYVMYQPIYSLKEKRFTTAEALVRLGDESEGYISPEEFIPLAEKNGMILQIGEFVFESVCRFILSKKIQDYGIEYLHVNLSVVQCLQTQMAHSLCSIMDIYQLDHSLVNFEVTETIATASSDILRKNMNQLIEKNINFSLDDFGTGFSNTQSLINFPFDTVKLDKSLIVEAMTNEKAKCILVNTIKMVKKLNMKVVAEGVETKEQSDMLERLGCDFIQGYYYSKPLTVEEFLRLIK